MLPPQAEEESLGEGCPQTTLRSMAKVFLSVDSISCVDLNTLSQSDLHSLSLTSSAAFDPCNNQDVVVPTPDPSIFNQSSATIRQTYSSSFLRSSHSSPDRRPRRRSSGLLPSPRHNAAASSVPDDLERRENVSIINCLKNLLSTAGSALQKQELDVILHASSLETHNRKNDMDSCYMYGDTNMEGLKDNGEFSVHMNRKGNGVDPYADELRRRTADMNSEDKLISFLKDLGGQWGSRRKKRKIVDASVLGDELPSGWKILIGIRRKVGHLSLYCRRYISPEGQLFMTCREALSYLQSYFGPNGGDLQRQQLLGNGQIQQTPSVTESQNFTEMDSEDHNRDDTPMGENNVGLPAPSASGRIHEKEDAVLGIDDLADVQVRDVFDCHKCRMTFDEKDTYLQHLLAYHQRATRRYRLGTSVSDGVIIKDGKYECQFCHKVFDERRRYNGHVGVHVRNYVRNSEESPVWLTPRTTPSMIKDEVVPPDRTKTDVMVGITQSSTLSKGEGTAEFMCGNEPSNSDSSATRSNDATPHRGACLGEFEVDRGAVDSIVLEDEDRSMSMDVEIEKDDTPCFDGDIVDDTPGIFDVEDGGADVNNGSETETLSIPDTCLVSPLRGHMGHGIHDDLNIVDQDLVNEMEYGDSAIFIGAKESANGDMMADRDFKKNSLNDGEEDDSVGAHIGLQSFEDNVGIQLGCVQASEEGGGKGGGFEELRMEEIEKLGGGCMTNEVVEAIEGMAEEGRRGGRRQFMTVCVWCRLEFNHVIGDSEIQADSVGFMCQSCKTKISGQLNLLGAAFSSSSSSHL